jgi:hypothetical protein
MTCTLTLSSFRVTPSISLPSAVFTVRLVFLRKSDYRGQVRPQSATLTFDHVAQRADWQRHKTIPCNESERVPVRTCPAGICRLHLWLSTLKSCLEAADIPEAGEIFP